MLTCCSKAIPARELPHTSEELGKASTEDGHAENNVGVGYVARVDIV